MYIRNIFVLFALIISGCATTYAPDYWLPETEDVPKETYGGWMTIITAPDTLEPEAGWLQYSGEFIFSDDDNVYLLFDSVFIINKNNIQTCILELDKKSSTEYGLWTLGGCAGTISNGVLLIFTAPLWLLAGIPVTVGESYRDRYEKDFPDEIYWKEVQKFARFPQKLPENIGLRDLKPKI